MDKNENQQPTPPINIIDVDLAVAQLEVFLGDHFAELDRLNNMVSGARMEERPRIQALYYQEGIDFRKDILSALKILRNHYAIEDYGKAELYRKEIGNNKFRDLAEAERYCDLVLDLLHNYQERTESLEDEIQTKEILEKVKNMI